MLKLRPFFLVFLMVIVFAHAKAQQAKYDLQIEAQVSELAKIRAKIEQIREEAERLKGKEVGILAELEYLERESYLLKKFLRQLDRSQRRLEDEIEGIRRRLAIMEDDLKEQQEKLARRLRQIYKYGELHNLEILLTSDSFPKLLRRYRCSLLIAEQDKSVYLNIKAKKRHMERVQAQLEARLRTKTRLKEEKEREEENLRRRKEARNRLLSLVRTQIKASQRAAAELEIEEERIRQLIARLEQARERERVEEKKLAVYDLARSKGKLSWPTNGRVESYFGKHRNPELKTTTINKGIDIAAPHGADIRCVAPGRAAIIDWFRGYGKFIIIDHHNGYYTLYAHASEILVSIGDEVEEGEVIAKVGDTGSLKGSMLHFEIRKGNKELDPMEWLR